MDMKNKKVCLNAEAINDRISNLPDEILEHILSFVDIKEGVQTCILSKRWKYVWTHVPSLNFNLVGLATNLTKERKNSFVNFMYQVLSGRGSSDLHKFSCYIMSAIDVNFLIVFVNRALTYNVQELEITYSNIVIPPNRKPKIFLNPFEILHSWFTAKSLSVLKLTCLNEGSMFFTGTLGLITLKELHLTKIKLSDNTDHMELISDSPNLKYLSLNECHFGKLKSLKINATQLTNLEILSPRGALDTQGYPWNCNVIVSAPNLSSFKYYSHCPLVCSMGNPLNMDTVEINIRKIYRTKLNRYNKEMGHRMIAMLLEFQHAKSVTLSLRAMKILVKVPGLLYSDSCPLRNLKNLKVNLKESSFLNGLNFILKNSPEAKTTLIGPSFRFNREDKAKSC